MNRKPSCLMRSSLVTSMADVGAMLSSVWELAGIDVRLSGGYPGWRPNPAAPIVRQMANVYKDLYGKEVKLEAIHAGLECSTIGSKYPNLDLIAIGPTLKDVHSPDEKMHIPSVKKVVELLTETLKRIPEK
ncbi:MAG TPA: M20/M25/M40 family metallo-hydrolase [Thermodesulfobacteriota bacterium]|nr:M20/M25/M40 family metallo-hydrolase [Thermodesulfobacteriota bacterium]